MLLEKVFDIWRSHHYLSGFSRERPEMWILRLVVGRKLQKVAPEGFRVTKCGSLTLKV